MGTGVSGAGGREVHRGLRGGDGGSGVARGLGVCEGVERSIGG